MDLFNGGWESDSSRMIKRSFGDDVSGGGSPSLADTGAGDDILPLRPLILTRFHTLDYLRQ